MPAPANDTRATAELLTGTTGSVSGTTVDATPEAGTVWASGWRDVWYYWASFPAGRVRVVLDPVSAVTARITLYAEAHATAAVDNTNRLGSVSTSTVYGMEVDHPGGELTVAVVTQTAVQTAFSFTWETPAAPTNDTRAAAELLTGNSGTVAGTTKGATGDAGTVYGPAVQDARDVWYYWDDLPAGLMTVTLTPDDSWPFNEISLWAEPPGGAGGDYTDPEHLDPEQYDVGVLTFTRSHPGGDLTLAVASFPFDSTDFDFAWSFVEGAEAEMVGLGSMTATTVIAAGPAEAIMDGTSYMIATSPAVGRRWRAVVTDVFGTTICELPKAVIGAITYQLNEPESWSLTLLQNDEAAAELIVPFREIQVWRGDQLLAWGPVVRWAYDQDAFVAYCKGALWHLTRRYIGKANRHNWVTNGSFEDGLSGWNFFTNPLMNAYGYPEAQPDPPTAGSVLTPKVEGNRSMSLVNAVGGADAFASQAFTFTVDSSYSPEGDIFTLKGYVYVSATIPDGSAPWARRGLYLERSSTTQINPDPLVQAVEPGSPLNLDHQFVALDEDTPVGVWQRFEIEVVSPPKAGEAEIIAVRLYAPADVVVYWDAVSLTLVEKLAFYNVDQALIVAGIVEHLQDAAYDKSDVNIDTHTPLTGIIRTRVYVHSEHPPGWRALQEFNDLDDGMDFRMVYTPTTRTLMTFYPQVGTVKNDYPLRLHTADVDNVVTDGNIARWSMAFDGERASSSVIVLGSGNGSDREEGGATNASGWSDNVTMEEVFVAPTETPIDSLAAMARERLNAARNPYSLEVTLTPPNDSSMADPIGNVWPGDSVPVTIQRHALDIDDIYRVARCTISPDGTMTMTLNLRVEAT